MTLFRTLSVLLLTLSALSLAACDSGDPEPEPGPADATVSITLQAIQADTQCDNASDNPGDFQFRIDLVDEGNNALQSLILPGTATYGTNNGAIELRGGQRLAVGETLTAQRPREEGSGFGLVFSGIEWDSATTRDVRFNDISSAVSFTYSNGAFQNIIGEKTKRLGPSDCDVVFIYSISIQ